MPDFNIFVITASSDSDGAMFAPLVLCLAGFIYYFWIYSKYRNTDKRHSHEKETTCTVEEMMQFDQLLEHRTGLRSANMSDSNDSAVEGSLSQSGDIPKHIKDIGGSIGLFKDGK